MTSWRRRCDVTTSHRRHFDVMCPLFLINQCQIITFLILKSDIENSRIELKGILLQVRSNQIKVTFIVILPFNLVHLSFFPVSHRNWRKMWVDYWGAKRYVAPPASQIIVGGLAPSLPSPMKGFPLYNISWLFCFSSAVSVHKSVPYHYINCTMKCLKCI